VLPREGVSPSKVSVVPPLVAACQLAKEVYVVRVVEYAGVIFQASAAKAGRIRTRNCLNIIFSVRTLHPAMEYMPVEIQLLRHMIFTASVFAD
jgi:hypothetical protein